MDSSHNLTLVVIFMLMFIFGDNILDFFNGASDIQLSGFYGLALMAIGEFMKRIGFAKFPKFTREGNIVINLINYIINFIGHIFIKGNLIFSLLISAWMMVVHGVSAFNPDLKYHAGLDVFPEFLPYLLNSFYLILVLISFNLLNYFLVFTKEFKKIESSNGRLTLLVTIGALIISVIALLR